QHRLAGLGQHPQPAHRDSLSGRNRDPLARRARRREVRAMDDRQQILIGAPASRRPVAPASPRPGAPASRRPGHAGGTPAVRARGTTLVELSLTLGVTAVIIMTLYGFLMTQAVVSLEESSELSKQNSIRSGAEQLSDELEMCKPRRLDSMGAWFE